MGERRDARPAWLDAAAVHLRLTKVWYTLRSSYWFLPALMALSAVGLAFLVAYLDQIYGQQVLLTAVPAPFRWVINTSGESSRSVLETIAGGMISVAAVAYSMTLIVLTLASSQFGPRILQLFRQDRSSQVVLGLLIALTAYCLVLLNMIERPGEGQLVPRIGLIVAFLWALLDLGAFVRFFHHVSEAIQAPKVIAAVGEDVERLTAALPEETAGGQDQMSVEEAREWISALPASEVVATRSGYVQVIDLDVLTTFARNHGITIRLRCRAGDWRIRGAPLAEVCGEAAGAGELDPGVADRIQRAFTLGDRRTPIQDFEFGIYQIEEIALRALSPSMNDPHTAITCVDELGALLAHLAQHFNPDVVEIGSDGRPLLIRDVTSFANLTAAAFNGIRQYGSAHVSVMIRVLETIAMVMPLCKDAAQREALARHGEMVAHAALEKTEAPADKADIEARLAEIRKVSKGETSE